MRPQMVHDAKQILVRISENMHLVCSNSSYGLVIHLGCYDGGVELRTCEISCSGAVIGVFVRNSRSACPKLLTSAE